MSEKIFLENLGQNVVNLRKQTYVLVDGVEYAVGEVKRKNYVNSILGRQQVQEEIPEPYKSAIMLMFGDIPTVNDGII